MAKARCDGDNKCSQIPPSKCFFFISLINDYFQRWRNAGYNDKFALPPRNEFIPTNFEITPREEESSPFPILIKDTSMTKLWFKQDDTFLLPKACMFFELTR